jgi:alkylhydroperoxidase/carboxymuconolactone decarboxylase family protein YurZ
MDIYTQELSRLQRELEATLTPKQRQLLSVGALTSQMCTPEQLEILKKMDSYLEGLTPEQAKQRAVMDTFAEGWEAGRESGQKLVKIMIVIFVGTLIIGIIVLIAR